MLSGRGKIAGILGWPVEHSLSPRLHNYWLKEYRIDGAYVPLPVQPDDLEAVIRTLPKLGFRGANLTLPHKRAIMPLLDSIDEEAKIVGAVNTIVIKKGKLHGSNTDIYGFAENIRPLLPERKKKAVILGAGGAGLAVGHALGKLGFQNIAITNRTAEKALALAQRLSGNISVQAWEKRSEILADADLLVNATSLGLMGKEQLIIDLSKLPKKALVTDIVYVPLMTPLLEEAKARGNKIVDGLGMLIHQAVPGFNAWFGTKPEVTKAVKNYLLSEKE